MNKIATLLLDRVKTDGWLSVSSVTFNNMSNANVSTSSGHIGISEDSGVMVWQSCEDIAYTQAIENKTVTFDRTHIGQMKTIVFQDLDTMEWFQAAQYTFNYTFTNPATEYEDMQNHPWPLTKYPKESDILAATYDKETGLWNCAGVQDALGFAMYQTESVIPLFDDNIRSMASAIVKEWYVWYTEHKLFKDYIKSQFGINII